MPSDPDSTYFKRRGRQSLAAMNAATDRGARLAHAQLAAAYGDLASPPPRDDPGDAADDAGQTDATERPPPAALMAWANEGGAGTTRPTPFSAAAAPRSPAGPIKPKDDA